MHHKLTPEEDGWSTTGDEFLSPLEIISRLKGEFACVTVDKAEGHRHMYGRINFLQNMQEKRTNEYWSKEAIAREIKHLESLSNDTYYVTFADSENPGEAYLDTAIMPNTGLLFGYSSEQDIAKCASLLERCAKALGYEIEEG